jgi:hypothetical protein
MGIFLARILERVVISSCRESSQFRDQIGVSLIEKLFTAESRILHLYKMGTWDFPGCPVVKNLPANAGDPSSIPGLGRSLEKEMTTLSSILAREIPWTEEHGGLSLCDRKELDTN